MMNERIKTKRKELKLTQLDVAKFIGVSKATISQWEAGDTSPNGVNLDKLSRVLRMTVSALLYGKERQTISYPLKADISHTVPLISWVQAGAWCEVVDNFQQEDTDEYYPCPEKHSEHTFALIVIGESMYPDFIPGEIIYVDPLVEPQSGSCVVVRQNGDNEATFKQLMYDGSKKYLKALNPNWPTPIIEMLPDAVICGVVIGSYRKRS